MIMDGAENGRFEIGMKRRITAFGPFLRKTEIDELPQLMNVLTGEMSLVGPRPEVNKWVKVYPEKWRIIHRIRPGITDPASIIYRSEEDILASASNPEKVYQDEILPRKIMTLFCKY